MRDPRQLRWGLVGYGDLAGKRVAAALKDAPGSDLRAVWGRDPAKARKFAQAHGIPRPHESLGALLGDEIDAVYVCTPPDTHAEYSLPALESGKHVMVEKPMAARVEDCERMLETASRHGVRLGVAYYRRAFPKSLKVKSLIDEGTLGTPTWVHMANHRWFNPGAGDPKHWRVEKSRSGGGGALADIGVHRFDLLEYWLGPAELAFRDLHHLVNQYEVEDGSCIVLRLANGAPVTAYFGWNSKTFADRFEMAGSEGRIVIDPLDGAGVTVFHKTNREELTIEPPANAHLPCVADFVSAVREHREPLCNGASGLRISRLIAQIIEGSSP